MAVKQVYVSPIFLYEEMKGENFEAIIASVCNEFGETPERAKELLDAFLQWFSLIPFLKSGDVLQMLVSVDKVWHSMILHTRFYREFCRKYVGKYVDHDPLDVQGNSLELKNQYANNTLKMLETYFGTSTNVHLLNLRENLTCCFFKRGCKKRNTFALN